MAHTNLPRSGVLVLGSNGIQSLLPATLTSQIEALLDSHRLADAADLADQQRKKLQSLPRVEEDEREELQYVYQRIGFQYLRETLFEDAGKALFVGELDPRVLVSYFPELRGTLFTEDDAVNLYAGVVEHMPQEASIDDIIQNYSPHLPPSTRDAPETAELRQVLRFAAEQMLEVFLRMWRFKLRTGTKGKGKASHVLTAVDTVLAKVYAKAGKTRDLHALIREPNDVVLDDVEGVLIMSEQYSALCRIFEKQGQTERLLDAWAKIADAEWIEHGGPDANVDALQTIEALVTGKRDRELSARWGVWMSKRDPDRGLRLILARDTDRRGVKGPTEEDTALLEAIQDANPAAASRFLEHLVLLKRSTNPALHMRLANSCVDHLLSCLNDEATHRLWRAKASSYTSGHSTSSFLSYFAGTTPDSEPKRIRLKTVMFLQSSALYNPGAILERITIANADTSKPPILSLELAILEGKLGHHRRALQILTQDLCDATSAEAYCAQGGDVVPLKTAHSIGETYKLQHWTISNLKSQGGKGAAQMRRQKTVDESVKKDLLKVLLEVYMSAGESNADKTARLLNAQAMNIDAVDVITLLPDDWHIQSMSTFLTQSLRRTLHAKHETQIVKNISMSENLAVAEEAWEAVRTQGYDVEEDEDGDSEVLDEKKDGLEDPVHIMSGSVDSTQERFRWRPEVMEEDSILR